MNAEKFPVTITEKGVSAVIRKAAKSKGGKSHNYFIVEYILLGKRKQVWRADLNEAKAVARDACIKIANGEQSALELSDRERLSYIRATEALSAIHVHHFILADPRSNLGICLRMVGWFRCLSGYGDYYRHCKADATRFQHVGAIFDDSSFSCFAAECRLHR
jgi:hypothetical protein